MAADDPKFACDGCQTEFRWKPELVGAAAVCPVCKAELEVPEHPTLTPIEDDALDDDDGGSGAYDLAEPGPRDVPRRAAPVTVAGAGGGHALGTRSAPPVASTAVPLRRTCPTCGIPAGFGAALCVNCGFDFVTGTPPSNRDRPALSGDDAVDRAAAARYRQAAMAAWLAPILAFMMSGCLGVTRETVPLFGLFVGLTQFLLLAGSITAGCYALSGMRQHGKHGILVPAAAGLALTTVVLLLGVMVVVLVLTGRVHLGPAAAGNPTTMPAAGAAATPGGGGTPVRPGLRRLRTW